VKRIRKAKTLKFTAYAFNQYKQMWESIGTVKAKTRREAKRKASRKLLEVERE